MQGSERPVPACIHKPRCRLANRLILTSGYGAGRPGFGHGRIRIKVRSPNRMQPFIFPNRTRAISRATVQVARVPLQGLANLNAAWTAAFKPFGSIAADQYRARNERSGMARLPRTLLRLPFRNFPVVLPLPIHAAMIPVS